MIGLDEKTTCPRHPKVETALRCASCGSLICPACLVHTPVGAKCRECSSQQSSALFKPSLCQAVAATFVGLAAGAFMGWAVEFSIGFFTLMLAVIYGGFAANMILRASGLKRGIRMEVIAGLSMTAGAVGGRLIAAGLSLMGSDMVHPPYGVWQVLVDLVKPNPIPAAALVIAIGCAISRIRYI